MTIATERTHLAGGSPKARGAYYTDERVARFLVEWAVRSRQDRVVDPSFGGGVFLEAACRRVAALGGDAAAQVFGVELDPHAHAATSARLRGDFGVPGDHLWRSDFFALDPSVLPQVGAVVGNPPFIRYHRFAGETRDRALACASRQGVRLSELSSSWAPFVVQSVGLLAEGGRMALVLPAELGHAAYARPVLAHLLASFGDVTLLLFRRKLFPHLSEDTLLLLAQDRGATCSSFRLRQVDDIDELMRSPAGPGCADEDAVLVSLTGVHRGSGRIVEYLIPAEARGLYRELSMLPVIRRLGDMADVNVGYVTGANDFFHLDTRGAHNWGIPDAFLARAVRRGRALQGLRFTAGDWSQAAETADAGWLLRIPPDGVLSEGVLRYIHDGERRGVPDAYKCRVRTPWYSVPHVHRADAFLTYMSGDAPRLVANEAGAVAPNTLHVVRARPGMGVTGQGLAGLWWTSLTRLSVEIEGHALGGGMLKIEPTEAERVLLPSPFAANGRLAELAGELDGVVRAGRYDAAHDLADAVLLRDGQGLTESECALLRGAAQTLCRRRRSRC